MGPDVRSIWQEEGSPSFASLHQNTKIDVCVVGAGITGLTSAYYLLLAGRSVVVIERRRMGQSESALSSAHLSVAIDGGFGEFYRKHGLECLRAFINGQTWAINEMERLTQELGCECEFARVAGHQFLASGTTEDDLEREWRVIEAAGNLRADLTTDRSPLRLGPCLAFPRQAQIHPVKYLNALAEQVQKMGGQIFTNTAASFTSDAAGTELVTESGGRLRANAYVLACHMPFGVHACPNRVSAYRTYALALSLPSGLVPHGIFWDTGLPCHYFRHISGRDEQRDHVLLGGEDHKTGQENDPESRYGALLDWARKSLSEDARPLRRWSGQILESHDQLALIGQSTCQEHVYYATGFGGQGLTQGTLAGKILADQVTGQENRWGELYDPSRPPWSGFGRYLRENINSAAQYLHRIPIEPLPEIEDIGLGEGAVVYENYRKLAVYRDFHNGLHKFSAVCPHRRGLVSWNSAEKSWDCACHGSRFAGTGAVVNGPAQCGLHDAREPGEITLPLSTRYLDGFLSSSAAAEMAGREGESA